jgi:hypothetical protein
MRNTPESVSWRPYRLSVVATLVLLSLQAWTGDFVNVFVTTSPKSGVIQSLTGFFQTVGMQGPFLVWHAIEGMLIVLSGVGVLVVSLRHDRRNVKLASLLGLFFVLSAGIGGYLFVLSGFSSGGSSMQMGGSFIAAYAFYFIGLYFSK